jgi:hypothetical protein
MKIKTSTVPTGRSKRHWQAKPGDAEPDAACRPNDDRVLGFCLFDAISDVSLELISQVTARVTGIETCCQNNPLEP